MHLIFLYIIIHGPPHTSVPKLSIIPEPLVLYHGLHMVSGAHDLGESSVEGLGPSPWEAGPNDEHLLGCHLPR